MRDRNFSSAIQELLRAQRNQIIVGPSWLGAPGGFLGQLPQTRVDFDNDERVCLDFPTSGSVTSGSTLVDNLNRIRAWLSPAKWFMPHATEPPSMYVYVEPGIAYLHGTTGSPIVFPGGFTSGSFVHETSGSPRIDLLYLEGNTGALVVEQGTPSSSPVAPWPLSGSPFPIAEVYMRSCSGSIFNRCSSGSATDNYIYRDVRPFITFPGAGGGGGGGLVDHTHTAIDGGLLDWDDIWTDAVHTHQAAGEGGQLDHGAALTAASLLDDDHTQYIKDSEFTAKGDLLVASAASTFAAETVGSDYEFLMADVSQARGVDWRVVPRWANVVVVAKTGGDYTAVTAALAAIVDASATNRYAILVAPDVGGETVTLKDYIDLIGLGVFCTAATAAPLGLRVAGSVTGVAIHNMLLADYSGASINSVNLTGGNVEFHGCRFTKSIYIQGGSHKFYECSMVVSDGLGLNIISCTQVDIFGGEYLNSDSSGEYAIRGAAGTINLYGVQTRGTGAAAGAYGILVNGATINVYGGSIYGYIDGIHIDSGTVNLYGGVSVVGGTDDINNAGGGVGNVYAASYDPDNVTGTLVGANKDTVIGDLTVIDDLMLNGISHGDAEPFDAHLNNPACRVYHDVNQNVATGGWRTLAFNSERFDTDTIHDLAVNNSRLTCKTAGIYQISATFTFAASAVGNRGMAILPNGDGTNFISLNFQPNSGAVAGNAMTASIPYQLAVNDYVEVQVFQDSGGALAVASAANYSPEFGMVRVG